jgi:ligand-binding SRPBCC domain-containing protein
MPIIRLETKIRAPLEMCFDLARSVELHMRSAALSRETAVGGVTSGLLQLNQEVTWEATHLFVKQRLTSRITIFDRPRHFRDSMVSGAFRRFDHDHIFSEAGGATLMTDVFDFTSPLGPLGKLADLLFLKNYLEGFLKRRAEVIRTEAESRT